ncbi:hypothetical protein NDU88_004894 [Pleurodeles waltl]|uniref:Uncharacterized protein n=1 Tax=Pleurodeles waltl TaxID=8319 RepID=A0AAV7SK89_PLEWA|nr:hypothetical protein NDU88_004894 [Pleurodeles waltl]
MGQALPSSSLPYPEGPRHGSLPGLGRLPLLVSVQGPQARTLAGPGAGAPVLVFVVWPPKTRAPGSLYVLVSGHLVTPTTLVFWLCPMCSYGVSRWPDCPGCPDGGSFASSKPARAPRGRLSSCRRSPLFLGLYGVPERGVAFLRIIRDRLLRTPLGSSGFRTGHRKGLGRTTLEAQMWDRLAALTNGSLLKPGFPQIKLMSQSLGWVLPSSSLPYPGGPWCTLGQGRLPLLAWVQGSRPGFWQAAGRDPLAWALSSGLSCGKAPGTLWVQGPWLGPGPQARAVAGPSVRTHCLRFVLCPAGWQIAWDGVPQALGEASWCAKRPQVRG